MKKSLLLSSLAILLFLGLMSSGIQNEKGNFIFSFMNDEPNLPDTPYEYSNIQFPSHITTDTIDTGYDGEVDTTILTVVDDDKSTLGRVLFYDKKLSAMENMNCASCHIQELSFADDKTFSEGISSLTTRNSMNLNDLGWSNKVGFFWDMEFAKLEDMIDIPFKDENEIGADFEEVAIKMSATEYYPELFEKAYGDSEINEERIVSALTNFIQSMVTFNSRFDQEANVGFTGFTEDELAGKELFSFHCATCHSEGSLFFGEDIEPEEMIFSFPFIFNNGLETEFTDLGTGDWLDGMNGLYKLPTMRNIAITGPYMHDGSLETLEDVIDFYSDDVVENEWQIFIPDGGFNFTDGEKTSLIAFLETLTDESFKTDVKWSDPFAPISFVPEIEEIEVSVAPNPMADFANITIDNNENSTAVLRVIDQTGRQVFTDQFKGNTYSFNKHSLPAGIYSVSISTEEGSKALQLIIQ